MADTQPLKQSSKEVYDPESAVEGGGPSRGPREHSTAWNANGCMDWPFVVLYIVMNLILLALLGAYYKPEYFKVQPSTTAGAHTNAFSAVFAGMAIGVGMSLMWLIALRNYPKEVIKAGLGFAVAMPLVMAVVCIVQGQAMAALFCFLGAAMVACFWYCVQDRIKLAAVMIEVAAKFIDNNKTLVCVSFGCLVVSRAMLDRGEQEDQNEDGLMCFLRCIARCILDCIEAYLEFFNTYAFVHVAIYGDDFCEAGEKTWDLFTRSGFDLIINDDLVGMALSMSAFAGGVVGGFVVYLIALGMSTTSAQAISLGVAGGFITVGCIAITMSIVSSAVAALFVCYCEFPMEGWTNHNEMYNKLTNAWREAYDHDFLYVDDGGHIVYINH